MVTISHLCGYQQLENLSCGWGPAVLLLILHCIIVIVLLSSLSFLVIPSLGIKSLHNLGQFFRLQENYLCSQKSGFTVLSEVLLKFHSVLRYTLAFRQDSVPAAVLVFV